MPLSEPELQPSLRSAPEAAPIPADAEPERLSASPTPADLNQRSQPQEQPRQPLDPGAVVIAAPKPAMPIAKGLPGPGLLAHLIVSKAVDHLPLHRLERVYQRQGLFLHRSTLCDWMAACANLLRPLYELMVSVVMQSRALHTDDTLERQAKDFSDGQRLPIRQELSLPILEQFYQRPLAQRPDVLPKSPMGEAISYTLNNWEALRRYTGAGFLAIDNNVSEREMKKIAIGRRN